MHFLLFQNIYQLHLLLDCQEKIVQLLLISFCSVSYVFAFLTRLLHRLYFEIVEVLSEGIKFKLAFCELLQDFVLIAISGG